MNVAERFYNAVNSWYFSEKAPLYNENELDYVWTIEFEQRCPWALKGSDIIFANEFKEASKLYRSMNNTMHLTSREKSMLIAWTARCLERKVSAVC